MQFGMPQGFQELLDRKYAILQQQADTSRIGVQAGANLDNTRAHLMPLETDANVAESRARTTNLGLTGQTILPLANSTIGLQGAQGRNLDAETLLTGEQTTSAKQINRVRPLGAYGLGQARTPYQELTTRLGL